MSSMRKKPAGAEDEEVDLQRPALVGDELEVGPGPVGIGVGQVIADVGKPRPLVGVARRGDLDPAVGVSAHGVAAWPAERTSACPALCSLDGLPAGLTCAGAKRPHLTSHARAAPPWLRPALTTVRIVYWAATLCSAPNRSQRNPLEHATGAPTWWHESCSGFAPPLDHPPRLAPALQPVGSGRPASQQVPRPTRWNSRSQVQAPAGSRPGPDRRAPCPRWRAGHRYPCSALACWHVHRGRSCPRPWPALDWCAPTRTGYSISFCGPSLLLLRERRRAPSDRERGGPCGGGRKDASTALLETSHP